MPTGVETAPNEVAVVAIATTDDDSDHPRAAKHTLASYILLYSFVAAVVLAMAGFVVVTRYLFLYLDHAFSAFDDASTAQYASMGKEQLWPILVSRSGLWKFILQSCGIISGVAFGFLGFALFLLGVKGDMDAAFDDAQHKVQLTRMAPGTFVLLIAAVLIGVCSTTKVELNMTDTVTRSPPPSVPTTWNASTDGTAPGYMSDEEIARRLTEKAAAATSKQQAPDPGSKK